MTFSFLGTGFPHLENKSTLAALDRLLVADSQTNMWNGKQITFAQFQAIVASNVESVNGLTGIVALGLTDLDDIPDPTTGSTFLSWNGSAFVWAGGGVGETNLAANVGSGADIWKDKDGVTFNFRGINGIQGIAAAVNSDNIDINFDVASLTSGQKTALVAATATEMAAAIDLTDLGDVVITTPSDGQVLTWNGTNWVNEDLPSSSGGFNINTLSLVTTSAAPANDMVAIYSASLAAHKKISITNFLALAGFTGDTYFKISSGDTTSGYGSTKLTATNGVKRIVVDPTGNESMSFELDYAALSAAVTPTLATSYLAILDHTLAYKKVSLTALFALDDIHLAKAGGTMTGLFREAQSTSLASGTITDLSTATGNLVHITGTSSITSFGTVTAGTEVTVVFDGILILTHNATSMILPNAGANITTAVGDVAIMRSEGSGNWRCVNYTRANGLALVTSDASNVTQLVDSTIPAGEAITIGTNTSLVFIEDIPTIANSLIATNLGDVSANTRIEIPVIGIGVSASTLKVALAKVSSPSADVGFRIETDNAGSPSGTLVHPNATGSVTAASITGGTAVSDASGLGTTYLGSTTDPYGYTIFSKFAQMLSLVVKSSGCNADRCRLLSSTGVVLATALFSGDNAVFAYPLAASTTYKVVVDKVSGGYYGREGSNPGTWPQNKTNINYIANSDGNTTTAYNIVSITTDNGVPTDTTLTCAGAFSFTGKAHLVLFAGTYGSETVNSVNFFRVGYNENHTTTRAAKVWNGSAWSAAMNTVFCYTSSALFADSVLSLTDSDYSYKIDYYGLAVETVAAGGYPKICIAGLDSSHTGLVARTEYFPGSTPGSLSSSAGTYGNVVGKAISSSIIEINKYGKRLGSATSGTFSGTAATDIFVNAYGIGNGTNTTLIGTSNGNVVASCSTGNLGGAPVFSICFPVKKGATWSVTGTMISQVCWVTPLS